MFRDSLIFPSQGTAVPEQNSVQVIQAIWTDHYKTASYMVDFEKKLALPFLLSVMQESAWEHAAHLGQGHRETSARGVAWVIVRQRVEMWEWPRWEEVMTLRTWLRPPSAAMVVRDFEFFLNERQIGQAAAHWITIDEEHRRPVRLGFPDNPALFRQDGHPDFEPRKLSLPPDLVRLEEFQAQNSDLDLHGHVNNTRFADWLLNSLPLAMLRAHRLTEYEINFLAEANPGERVTVFGSPLASLRPGDSGYFQGLRTEDDKTLFHARLRAV